MIGFSLVRTLGLLAVVGGLTVATTAGYRYYEEKVASTCITVLTDDSGDIREQSPIILLGKQIGKIEGVEVASGGRSLRLNACVYPEYQELLTTAARFHVDGARLEMAMFKRLGHPLKPGDTVTAFSDLEWISLKVQEKWLEPAVKQGEETAKLLLRRVQEWMQ
ncbi:MAG: MlaD family protein [Candidatus Uhrbacteria bacterium]